MDLFELGSVMGDFFKDGNGPSHDELDGMFTRAGLQQGDPALLATGPVGKMKRVRGVISFGNDHHPAAALALAQQLLAGLRADGVFAPSSPTYAGEHLIERAQDAWRGLAFDLASDGRLTPLLLDGLTGTELTSALRIYVDRINRAPDDPALQVGTGKDLIEATARHVLVENTGAYQASTNFPMTMTNAYYALGWTRPTKEVEEGLTSDPHRALQESLYLLARAVNRLRNQEGTGHGRPTSAKLSAAESRTVARATALIAAAMLDSLEST